MSMGNTLNLSKVIFWDTDYESIDWEKNARYVIARVIQLFSLILLPGLDLGIDT